MGLGGPCVELVFSRMESQTAPQDQEVEDPGQPPRVCLGKGKALEGDQEKQSRRKAIKMKVLTCSSVCVGGCTAKEEAQVRQHYAHPHIAKKDTPWLAH